MQRFQVQVFMSTLLAVCSGQVLFGSLDGFPHLRYSFREGPLPPHPLSLPPPPHHLPPPAVTLHHTPLLYRLPHQTVLFPASWPRPSFPPLVERIIQRIQTYWSVYNPPELLTRPPPYIPTTTKSPKKKVSTTTTTPAPQEEEEEDNSTLSGLETTTATTTTTTEDPSTTKVSTLAVFEVTPTRQADPPVTPVPPDHPADTEEPAFITPESLLGQKDAFLRFLQTGKIPPPLENRFNEMEDVFR